MLRRCALVSSRNSSIPLATLRSCPRAYFVSTSPRLAEKQEDATPPETIYESPLALSCQSLKRVSVTTAALSMMFPPALMLQAAESSVPVAGQVAITSLVLAASLGSTSLIHFLFSPYILKMARCPPVDPPTTASSPDRPRPQNESARADIAPNKDMFEAKTMTLFGGEKTSSFALSEVAPVPKNQLRPFVSFWVGRTPYFVHGSVFQDKALLRKLLGRPLTDAEKGLAQPPG